MSTMIVCCALLGGAAGSLTPRIAYRLGVEAGRPPRGSCVHCGSPFPAGVAGWVRVGPPCGPRRPRPRSPDLRSSDLGPPEPLAAAGCRSSRARLAAAGIALVGAVVAAGFGAALGPAPELVGFLAAGVVGVLLAAVDVRCLRLPNALVAVFFVAAAGPLLSQPDRLGQAAAAGGLCAMAYLCVALLPGGPLGFGDVKLGAGLGFLLGWLGWPAVLLGLVLPHVLNGPVALCLLLTRRAGRRTALPFGPALLGGAFLAVVLGGAG
jgi:leader peptidase (prepilin peptidase)/N-methyltransferase